MVKHRLCRKSTSVIELLVAMTIFAMISYLVLSSMITSRATSTVSGASIFLNSQAQLATSTITRELMIARNSDIYYNDASCGGSNCIGFNIPVLLNGDLVLVGGNPVFGDGQTGGNYIRYILTGTDLQRQALASDKTTILTVRTFARNLQAFTINYNPATSSYTLALTFWITSYEGIALSPALTLNSSITVVPRN